MVSQRLPKLGETGTHWRASQDEGALGGRRAGCASTQNPSAHPLPQCVPQNSPFCPCPLSQVATRPVALGAPFSDTLPNSKTLPPAPSGSVISKSHTSVLTPSLSENRLSHSLDWGGAWTLSTLPSCTCVSLCLFSGSLRDPYCSVASTHLPLSPPRSGSQLGHHTHGHIPNLTITQSRTLSRSSAPTSPPTCPAPAPAGSQDHSKPIRTCRRQTCSHRPCLSTDSPPVLNLLNTAGETQRSDRRHFNSFFVEVFKNTQK